MSGIYGTRDVPQRLSVRSKSHPAVSSNGIVTDSDDKADSNLLAKEATKIPYNISRVHIERSRIRSGNEHQGSDDDLEGSGSEAGTRRDYGSLNHDAISLSSEYEMEKEITERNYRILMQQLAAALVEKETLLYQVQIIGQGYSELKNQLTELVERENIQPKRLECLREERCRLADTVICLSATTEEQCSKKTSSAPALLQNQRDLWRNKFLVNSLIVDELTNHRLFLLRQMEEAQEVINGLLDEKEKIREGLFEMFLYLQDTKETLDPLDHGKHRRLLACHSVDDLLKADQDLSRELHRRLLNTTRKPPRLPFTTDLDDTSGPSILPSGIEEKAKQITSIDVKAFAASNPSEDFQQLINERAKKFALPPPVMHNIVVNCCKRCEGQIKIV